MVLACFVFLIDLIWLKVNVNEGVLANLNVSATTDNNDKEVCD